MISTDFAPNESWDDAILSLKLLLQPWRWKKGKETNLIKKEVLKAFKFPITNCQLLISLFFSGRSALYYLLKSLNLPEQSEIIVQAFTCEAVVLSVLANGLKPIYIDIEPRTYSMDVKDLKRKLTKQARVLILQHTFGTTPIYREEILRVAKKYNLYIIEDLAHGFNPKIFSPNNLSLIINNFFLLSFGRSKALSSVFGGAIVSSNNLAIKQFNNLSYPSYWYIFKLLLYKPLVMLIKSTYDFGLGKILHKIFNFLNLLTSEITNKEKRGEYDNFFNQAYPNALAILLLNQLKKFEKMQKQRKEIVNFYLKNLKKIFPHYQLLITNYSLIRLPLLIKNRDEVVDLVQKHNIFLGQWYNQVVAPRGDCPTAEKICQQIINLPTNISQKEAEKVIKIWKSKS